MAETCLAMVEKDPVPTDTGVNGQAGRLRPLAMLSRSGQKWVAGEIDPDKFGGRGGIYWSPADPAERPLAGHLVKVGVVPTNRAGEADQHWWQPGRKTNGRPDLERFGRFLLDAREARWRSPPRRVAGLPEDARFYVKGDANRIVGPFVSGAPLDPAADDAKRELHLLRGWTCAAKWSTDDLDEEDLFAWEDGSLVRECLLHEPPKGSAEFAADLKSPEEVAKWLLAEVSKGDPALVKPLLERRADLEAALAGRLEKGADPLARALAENRWENAVDALKQSTFSPEEFEALVRQTPHLMEGIRRELSQKLEVDRRKVVAVAEAEAARTVAGAGAEADRIVVEARERAARESPPDSKWAELAEAEARLSAAAGRFAANRDSLAADVLALEGVLRAREGVGSNGSNDGARVHPPAPPPTVKGPPITDEHAFARDRFESVLAHFEPSATRAWADRFHVALLACRWVLAPHAGWGRAYAEAVGGACRVRLVAPSPDWLTFADAWAGGLGACFEGAAADPSRLHLAVIHEIDLSLPRLWARPLFDWLAGWRSDVPAPTDDVVVPWPDNLRLIACPCAGAPLQPLDESITRHWAAVRREPISDDGGAGESVTSSAVKGHVTVDDWLAWARVGDEEGDEAEEETADDLAAELQAGPLTYGMRRDVRRLWRVLMRRGGKLEANWSTAARIRCRWAKEYLPGEANP